MVIQGIKKAAHMPRDAMNDGILSAMGDDEFLLESAMDGVVVG